LNRLAEMGFSYAEAQQLRKIERTLHRWNELECGDGNDRSSWSIERDETTGKPFFVRHNYRHGQGANTITKTPIADREAGALRRLAVIMAGHPELVSYHQGDCRGCALYILRKTDVPAGEKIDSVYTRGEAVCA
jgi:hypothetical protein